MQKDIKPLVTIAISVYNVGRYIDTALDSIETQTYKNAEILCIDDASTDDTYDRIMARAEKDSRYRVIRLSHNQGLSVSRNTAIAEAKGKYIVMLDGDDLFDKDMIRRAVDVAESNGADIVMWDYQPFQDPDDLKNLNQLDSELSKLDFGDKIGLLQRPAFMWTRLLRVDCLRECCIHFEPGLTKQDIPVHWKLVTSWDKIVLLPMKLSFYRLQPNATSCRKDKSVFSLAKVMDIVEKQLHESGLYETYKSIFWKKRLELLQGMYDFIKPELKEEAMQMIRDRIDGEGAEFLRDSSNMLTPRVRTFYKMIQGNTLAKVRYNLFLGTRAIYRKFK